MFFYKRLCSNQWFREEAVFRKIIDNLNSCNSEDYLFLDGDFNCSGNETLDCNHAEPHPASQHALSQLIYSPGLVDVLLDVHTQAEW